MDAFAFPDKTQEYDGAQTINVKYLGGVGTVQWDLRTQQNAEIVLGANVTMATPTGWKAGRLVMLEVIQDATGSRTITWASTFLNMTGATLGTTAGSSNIMTFKCCTVSGQPRFCLMSNLTNTRA